MHQLAIIALLLLIPGTSVSWLSAPENITAGDICQRTFAETSKIETLQYQMQKEERIGGEMKIQKSFIKLNRDPYQVYIKQLFPKKGLEVLYHHDKNDQRALVNPNGFPWMTLKMDPEGSTMLKNQHHTVKDAGYDLLISILKHLFDKYEKQLGMMLSLESPEIYEGHSCYKVTFKNDRFRYIQYQVEAGENILDIARKRKLCGYLILAKNNHFHHYDDVSAGDQIMIPNDYSSKMELLIDQSRFIPLSIKVYDDAGLLEHYQYSEVQINPGLSPVDFSRDNKNYGF